MWATTVRLHIASVAVRRSQNLSTKEKCSLSKKLPKYLVMSLLFRTFACIKNNAYNVIGKGTPLVYINNRLVRDNTELNQLNSSEIKVRVFPLQEWQRRDALHIFPEGNGIPGTLNCSGRNGAATFMIPAAVTY